MSLESQLARAIAVLQAQKKPKRYIVVSKPKRPAGGKRRSVGPRGGTTEVQSLLFPVKSWTVESAIEWAIHNRYRYGDVDAMGDRYIRLRQSSPSRFKRMRTKVLGHGIKAVVGVRR